MRASVKTSASLFSCVFAGLYVLGGVVQAQPFAGGTGEAGDPYRIAAAEQLLAIETDPSFLEKCFVLVADIDLDPNLPGGRAFDAALIAPDLLDANGLETPGVPLHRVFRWTRSRDSQSGDRGHDPRLRRSVWQNWHPGRRQMADAWRRAKCEIGACERFRPRIGGRPGRGQ